MEPIILELYNRGRWWDAAEVTFSSEAMNQAVTIAYLNDYIASSLAYEARDNSACTVNAPVTIIPAEYPGWPALFNDILPVGKSREWWLNYLGELAENMVDLPDRLRNFGCPDEILDFPSFGFDQTEAKLIRMGVLSE